MELFQRTELAERIADLLLNPNPALNATSGLFLAAPRRTGKSTFLREDLRPALERRDAFVVYVDLWSDRDADPRVLIDAAIRNALESRAGATGLIRRIGIDQISVAGVSISRADERLPPTLTLSGALEALSTDTGRPIALLVDEAQHAISTSAGANALYGLKAARDELNSSRLHGLRIIATGSNRDKLAMLVNTKDQAFFLADLLDLPPLDDAYVRWFVAQQPFQDELDIDATRKLFARLGHRPEFLDRAARRVRQELAPPAGTKVQERLTAFAEEALQAADAESIASFERLSPVQAAVLRVLASNQGQLALFDAMSLARYDAILEARVPPVATRASRSNVQAALRSLQKAGLVWRSARGAYALEDARLALLLRERGLLG